VVQLAFWSQLGVLTRIYVDKLSLDGCQGSWGVCLTSEGKIFEGSLQEQV
jgi:hypothetical protein